MSDYLALIILESLVVIDRRPCSMSEKCRRLRFRDEEQTANTHLRHG
jgi:hypothetical protein